MVTLEARGPDISVIVLNYRAWRESARALRSAADAAGHYRIESIVVDNGSADGSVAALREEFPEAAVIGLTKNLGFAAGMNAGICASTGRHILLLNSDVVAAPESVRDLVDYLSTKPDVGIVAPALVDSEGRCARSFLTRPTRLRIILPFLAKRAYRSMRGKLGVEPLEVEATEGAAVLTSREAISRVGLMDERFFFYYEIVDWCMRMANCGLRVVVLPTSRMEHAGGSSTPRVSARIEFKRSEYQLIEKMSGGPLSRVAQLRDLSAEVLQVLFYGISRLFVGRNARVRDKLRVHFQLLRWFACGMPERLDQSYVARFGGWD